MSRCIAGLICSEDTSRAASGALSSMEPIAVSESYLRQAIMLVAAVAEVLVLRAARGIQVVYLPASGGLRCDWWIPLVALRPAPVSIKP
mmetsp:Transcript_28659/g.81992  ORF Transcript_28659/g.81992 Transcript_28659/m.81992 type:complete len:89 (-) Transcript_28659:4-270(-)